MYITVNYILGIIGFSLHSIPLHQSLWCTIWILLGRVNLKIDLRIWRLSMGNDLTLLNYVNSFINVTLTNFVCLDFSVITSCRSSKKMKYSKAYDWLKIQVNYTR